MNGKGFLNRLFTYRRVLVAVLVAWSASIGGLAWWYHVDHTNDITEMAYLYARACHDMDMIYRCWDKAHVGLYVPGSKNFQPSWYLKAAEQDVNLACLPASSLRRVKKSLTILQASSQSPPTIVLTLGNRMPFLPLRKARRRQMLFFTRTVIAPWLRTLTWASRSLIDNIDCDGQRRSRHDVQEDSGGMCRPGMLPDV